MSNSWFQFRQFRIEQDNCAMEVTTDACIQGAWTPILPNVKRVLDIGAGTGLLSLMLAQRQPGIIIDAIEYDPDTAKQCADNVSASLWHDRITVLHGDVRDHKATDKYDLIICNPPFFTNSLLGDKEQKNRARHDVSLSKEELLTAMMANLADNGYFSILLPYPEYQLWKAYATGDGLHEMQSLHVQHKHGAAIKRIVGILSKGPAHHALIQTMVIKNDGDSYSADFKELLAPFYLNL